MWFARIRRRSCTSSLTGLCSPLWKYLLPTQTTTQQIGRHRAVMRNNFSPAADRVLKVVVVVVEEWCLVVVVVVVLSVAVPEASS